MKLKLITTTKISRLDPLWKRDGEELGNSLLSYPLGRFSLDGWLSSHWTFIGYTRIWVIKEFLSMLCRGEKYMGMWEADCRQGPGLLVTLDGIYNQGTFLQNKLMVCWNNMVSVGKGTPQKRHTSMEFHRLGGWSVKKDGFGDSRFDNLSRSQLENNINNNINSNSSY